MSMLKINLSCKDRITINGIFPERFSIADFKLKDSIISKLAFTADEITKHSIKVTKNAEITWDEQFDNELKPFFFTEDEMTFLTRQVEKLDHNGELTDMVVGVAMKIASGEYEVLQESPTKEGQS